LNEFLFEVCASVNGHVITITDSAPFLLLDCDSTKWRDKFSARSFRSFSTALGFLFELSLVEEESSSVCSSSCQSLTTSAFGVATDTIGVKVIESVSEANALLRPQGAAVSGDDSPPFVVVEDLGIVRFFFCLNNFATGPDDPKMTHLAQ
jgi:hypothetical protein